MVPLWKLCPVCLCVHVPEGKGAWCVWRPKDSVEAQRLGGGSGVVIMVVVEVVVLMVVLWFLFVKAGFLTGLEFAKKAGKAGP